MMLWTAPALRHRSAIETRRSYLRTLTIHRARAALAKLEASRVREADGLLAFACVGVESGRKLRRHAYAAKALLLPIWIAKAVAILASFITNLSLSHFVVFPVRDNSRPKMLLDLDRSPTETST
jgi:hypothetical protein